jgi:AP2-associated kinase
MKRPDIFQVSYLAFSLAERPCPVKNINVSFNFTVAVLLTKLNFFFNFKSSEIPTFSQLQAPLTDTEWRKTALMMNQQKKQQTASNENNTTTTVNPRERPKANINPINPILQLSNSNFSKRTPSQPPAVSSSNQKINVSIKPTPFSFLNEPSQSQVSKEGGFGFDDDFSSLNPASLTPTNVQAASPIQNNTSLPVNNPISNSLSSNELINNQDLFQVPSIEKKMHRRSASQ